MFSVLACLPINIWGSCTMTSWEISRSCCMMGEYVYLVLYHYKSNAIMAMPITGLDEVCIFNAYKLNFDELKSKGYYKQILNVIINQATKYKKKFLTKEECKLQLVEPHNHRVNAAKWAIQTFKDAFIAALTTTDRNFPLQLWDKLTMQVVNTLNMMHASRIDPTISAYEILHGPYDWNRYPLTPLGCKAVVYKDRDTRGLWASRGVDGWYLGPSMDHYRRDICYIPETQAYQISGSTELFPQHCQLPDNRTNTYMPSQMNCPMVPQRQHTLPRASIFYNFCRTKSQQCLHHHLLWRNKGWRITI